MKRRLAVLVLTLLLCGAGIRAGRAVQQTTTTPVVVLCSIAVESVLQELRPVLLRDAGVDLRASCDLAATVAGRVRSGAPFDVVVLTPGLTDSLAGEGRIAPGSRVLLGRSPVALAQRTGGPRRDVSTPDRLRRQLTASPAIAFARTGASGTFFTTLLAYWGVADAFAPRLRPLASGPEVSAAVVRGEADLAVLPVSEILPVAGLEVAGRFPAELDAFVVMEAAGSSRATDAPGARAFMSFLRSADATRALQRAGFDEVPPPVRRTGTGDTVSALLDQDRRETEPVAHRYLHGVIPDDARFQIALPDAWNGKLVIFSRGFSGTEMTGGGYRTTALQKGYAFAASDEGWNRKTIAREPEDSYFESRQRIRELTGYAGRVVSEHYGRQATRTLMIGGSNGGHHTKWMLESDPGLYDGGIAGYGFNSQVSQWGSIATFLRHYDAVAARIDDIVAARANDPAWNPRRRPLDPPLTAAQLDSLDRIYSIPVTLADGFRFDVGRWPGSEARWKEDHDDLVGYLRDSMPRFDPTFNPGGGPLTDDELRRWEPIRSPPAVLQELRRLDLTGRLTRPLIIMHGRADVIVSPGETAGYQALVARRLGRAAADRVLAVYYIPGMGHGGTEFNGALAVQFDALEAWLDHLESRGARGSPPPPSLAGYPRTPAARGAVTRWPAVPGGPL